MNNSITTALRFTAALVSFTLVTTAIVACNDTPEPPAKAPSTIPAGLITKGPAAGTGVSAVKVTSQQGDTITLVGRIGGSEEPFGADRAVFTIVDPALKSCADAGDPGHCETPWDYCCEDRASLKRSTATIEIAGPDGRPLKVALRGVSGLDPLATVAVTGTVIEQNDAGVLVVRATKIEIR